MSMRAIQLNEFNGPLTLVEVDVPTPGQGEVLLDLHYAAVNPLDVWVTQGNFAAVTKLPHIPGVEAVGTMNGRMVLVRGNGIGVARLGTYAEHVAVPLASIVPVPDGVNPQQAAAMGVAGLTAWRCVHDCGQTHSGSTVLVTGASGGVGSLAVQLAKSAGARVIGQTSNPAKADAITASGADRVIVAAAGTDLVAALDGEAPTVIIDGVAGDFVRAGIDALALDSRYVNYGTSAGTEVSIDMRTLYRKGVTMIGYTGLRETDTAAAFASLFDGLASGSLTVDIDAVLPLSSAAAAHRRILDRSVTGKLLLDVRA
jgi:NADPH:quinone reductase